MKNTPVDFEQLFYKIEAIKKEWERIADCTLDIILLVDEDGKIKRCNKKLADFTETNYDHILGKDCRQFFKDHGIPVDNITGNDIELFHKLTGTWFVLNSYPYKDYKDNFPLSGNVIILHDFTELKKITDEILGQLRENVIKALQQSGKEIEPDSAEDSADKVKDGMDIALCVIDEENMCLEFSGANNPMYLISCADASLPAGYYNENQTAGSVCEANRINSGQTENLKENTHSRKTEVFTSHSGDQVFLTEIKGDKMPIGIYYNKSNDPFSLHRIQLQKGDTIYIFSDGFADQFGGPLGKKFKYKPFKQLLVDNCKKTMEEQKEILGKAFINWKGDLAQVDDIVAIGIKI